jgi:DNA-binding CsgD family transcriptional regulator
LGTAFGLRSGSAPDKFRVGLAALTLFSQVAEERPLVCVIDDAQWLDQASATALEFVARRLVAEPIAMAFAARPSAGGPPLAGLPELAVQGLAHHDAAELLDGVVPGPLDVRVRDRILAETQGNPLAVIELPRALSTADLTFGGAADADATLLAHRLEQGFLRQLAPLPRQSRRLLLVAAAEPVGDVPLLRDAAGRLGISSDDVSAAEAAGLIELGDRARFRHPLIRSAIYRSATPPERREVHRALADATDPEADPDRRAWHLAQSVMGPDETVAAELERSAGRALAHGGLAAAATFLQQAAALTPDPVRHVRRSLDAAQAKVHAGEFDDAQALVTTADVGPIDDFGKARADLLRAQIAFAANRGNEALPLLLAAAHRLEPLDARLARDTYLDAMSASLFAGRLAPGRGAHQVAQAVRAAPPAEPPRKADELLEAVSMLFTDGYAAAAGLSHRAVQSFVREDLDLDEGLRFSWLAASTAVSLWDESSWDALTRRHLEFARKAGALGALPLALTSRAFVHLFTGNLDAASALVDEIHSVAEVTGGVGSLAPYAEVCLAAVRGDEERAEPLLSQTLVDLTARGEGVGVNMMQWARAVLFNGVGRARDALIAAREATADPLELGPPKWALAELVEAAVHSGDQKTAAAALEQLTAMTQASGTDWALGIEASRGALLRAGDAADDLHHEAIERLSRTTLEVELARARLLYGEWLRRAHRRVDARAQLRAAYEALTAMGIDAFAERARRELLATGETLRRRRRRRETLPDLTAQEGHIARLITDGLSNTEIAVSLYISPRTVEWHVGRIFGKLQVSSRQQLRQAFIVRTGTTG